MSAMNAPYLRHWMSTHPGAVRSSNQDAMLCRPEIGLFAVADGAGGHQNGAMAASLTLDRLAAIPASVPPEIRLASVRSGCMDAHRQLRALGGAHGPDALMATTLVLVLVHRWHFACLWAGDSRAYLLREGTLHRLTSDHSIVQSLIDAGDITEAEADAHPSSHVITRAIGAGDPAPVLDKSAGTLMPGDRLLLCSDGLYKTLPDAALAALLEAAGDSPEDMTGPLIQAALARGARDNVTAVVVELSPA
jgi:serine/threonine protein phosphatase Stp1